MNLTLSLLLPELFADLPLTLLGACALLLGTFVGSFLNVVIHRVPQEEGERDIVFKPSHCPNCKAAIKPYDNIPIISYLILGGRCRNCKVGISPRYVAVEAITGLLWLLLLLHNATSPMGLTWVFLSDIALATALVALIFIDSEHMILPDVITFPIMLFALGMRIILPLVVGSGAFDDLLWLNSAGLLNTWPLLGKSLLCAVIGALAGGGTLWLLNQAWIMLRGYEGMGLGDVKMMLGVGAYLGWRMVLVTLFLSAITGSVIGIALMLYRGERNLQFALPYGIFLGFASIICLLTGPTLLEWYLSSFR